MAPTYRRPRKGQGRGILTPAKRYTPPKSGSRRRAYDKAINTVNAMVNPYPVIARGITDALMAEAPKDVSTQTTRKRKRGQSDNGGVTGGKFSRKGRSNPFAAFIRTGSVLTREVGCLVTGQTPTRPVFVGHATHSNFVDMTVVFFRSLVRQLFNKHGCEILDMETDSPGAYRVVVEYVQNNATAAALVQNFATTGQSYVQLADSIRGFFTSITDPNAIYNTLLGRICFFITDVTLQSADGSVTFCKQDYRDAYVHIKAKSDLKLQNRTLASGTDEDANSTENVGNQPLYGKIYTGKGNGLLSKVDSAAASVGKALICSENISNILAYAPGTADYWLEEPPLPSLFTPKPKYSNARIEPGQLKTNVLVATWKVKQTDFWQMLAGNQGTGTANAPNIQNRYGKFSIFALEKMICVTATDTNPVVGLECNTRIGCYFQFKRKKTSAEIIENQTFAIQANGPNIP